MIYPRCLVKDGDKPCDGFDDLHRRCKHYEEEWAQAVRGWKQAVVVIEAQQKALDWINARLIEWNNEGRLPQGEPLARDFYDKFERGRSVGADYVKAMRHSGAI